MDLALTEAWALWWSGQQLTDHTLYGAPVLWLGRAGKLLAFLAGTTIVVDAIGPERILAWGKGIEKGKTRKHRIQQQIVAFFTGLPMAILGCSIILLVVLAIGLPFWTYLVVTAVVSLLFWKKIGVLQVRLVDGFGRLLARPLFERQLRITASVLFVFGFALDYLAS